MEFFEELSTSRLVTTTHSTKVRIPIKRIFVRFKSVGVSHLPESYRSFADRQCESPTGHKRGTAGLDVQYEPTKNNFLMNQRGYDKSETTDEKLSARRI